MLCSSICRFRTPGAKEKPGNLDIAELKDDADRCTEEETEDLKDFHAFLWRRIKREVPGGIDMTPCMW